MPSDFGAFALHRQRIRVVEPEGTQHLDAVGRERRIQLRGLRCRVELQDRAREGAGVFDVNIDLAVLERLVADQRAAKAESALDFIARVLQQLRDDFAEQIPLVEVLTADDDALGRERLLHGADQRERGDHALHANWSVSSAVT